MAAAGVKVPARRESAEQYGESRRGSGETEVVGYKPASRWDGML